MQVSDSIRRRSVVDRCAVCGGTELFVRKDFPRRLGLAVVILFGLTATYWFTIDIRVTWALLAAAVVIDLIIYAVIGRVTTCYACRAEYRRCPLNPAHGGFDLATSEKY
jgi:hypothetical protein